MSSKRKATYGLSIEPSVCSRKFKNKAREDDKSAVSLEARRTIVSPRARDFIDRPYLTEWLKVAKPRQIRSLTGFFL
jgi:hypothetical protein